MSKAATWSKLGHVFCPSGEYSWMSSHAAVPLAQAIDTNLIRIYFSTRDRQNRSFTAWVVIDIREPGKILDLSAKPVLAPGQLGEFDDSGAMGSWLTTHRDQTYFYYIGWNLGVTVPFRNAIGLAVSSNGENFERAFSGPIVDRSKDEPHFCASCCVLKDQNIWRMWYLSCTGWQERGGRIQHNYHIKYAESDDGVEWRRNGVIAIDYANTDEYAISRPSVIRDADRWKMWFSARGANYRIGYAESNDGRSWQRHDHLAGIDVSPSGWDSQMIEYPFVFDHGEKRYMLYNGNGYGKTGFGIAVLEN